MKAIVLYSGGKDSSLVAHFLKQWGYEVLLVTANFGVMPECIETAQKAAESIGFPFEPITLDSKTIEEAADQAQKDGFPLNAINIAHHAALEGICAKYKDTYKLITDGTRRDDKTPRLTLAEMQSLEDRHKIEYSPILCGLSYKTIKYLTDAIFLTESVQAGSIPTSEYETEIRATLRARGDGLEKDIFPENHYHTIVKGYKK
ncbi:MAG: 7-cyano-7-deazaguanine synthase [archaeon]